MECLIKIQKLLEKGSHDLQSLATQFTGLLNPHVQVTLLGWAYAFYFSPRDLILASDPWFVRRHRFSRGVPERNGLGSNAGAVVRLWWWQLSHRRLAQMRPRQARWGWLAEMRAKALAATPPARRWRQWLASLRSIPWAAVDEHGPRRLA
jgi:hypothetical protein